MLLAKNNNKTQYKPIFPKPYKVWIYNQILPSYKIRKQPDIF